MRPRWQPSAIAATVYDISHRSAIDLKMETDVPSEVRCSFDSEAARRDVTGPEVPGTSLRKRANEHCAPKNENQKNDAGEAVSCFHSIHYTCELRFDQHNEPAILEAF